MMGDRKKASCTKLPMTGGMSRKRMDTIARIRQIHRQFQSTSTKAIGRESNCQFSAFPASRTTTGTMMYLFQAEDGIRYSMRHTWTVRGNLTCLTICAACTNTMQPSLIAVDINVQTM